MRIADGCLYTSLVDVRKIMQGALLANSSGIILAHNHPSGAVKPSPQEISITKDFKKASDLHKIKLLDHVILTPESYLSFAAEGIL